MRTKITLATLFLMSLCTWAIAQVVWTEPPFPTQVDDITLYFDAAEGNAALEGFSGTVYAHTGVITSQSTAPNDWKHVQGTWGTPDPNVVMMSEGNNVYSMTYNIETYYGINAGEVVEKLAFVFRNADGSIVGRDTDGSDIFLDVFPPDGLLINLQKPLDNTVIFINESLPVELLINKVAAIEITDNGETVFSGTTDEVNINIDPNELGEHELEFTITEGGNIEVLTRNYYVLDDNEITENPPSGVKNGLNYNSEDSYTFVLTAPQKDHIFLLCPANNYQVDIDYRLRKSTDGTQFWINLPQSLFENGQNSYQYLVDGQIKIADPFAEIVLDPWNDDDVPADALAGLPDYPEDMTTGIVSAFDLEKANYDWQVNNFQKPEKENLVIYEILMRDFLEDKNYKSLLDTLNYLDKLGINAIELMPIQEFEGNQSWGYNPSFHMAVDKYYGSRDQLRAVIDAAHERGIAVILDVVFNHAFSQSPLCQLYWNPAAFRPAADNPWLNEIPRHPFNVGYDFNHESEFTKDWVKQVLEYWITEFRFDGFRFDLSKGLTQTNSGNNSNLMAQYDASRIAILKEYADFVWSLDSDSYVIMEHFAANNEERELSDYGMMLWSNTTFQFAEAAMGYASDLDGADYTARGWSNPHLIAYMESHDEERMGYKLQTWGNSNANYDTQYLPTAAQRVAAASSIYMSIPGPKMLWQFGELDYNYSINRCVNGSINEACRLDPKPIRWDYFENPFRRDLYERIAALNYLKTNYPTFTTSSFDLDDSDAYIKKVHLTHPDMDAVTLANFEIVANSINPEFPYSGTWYEYFTGDEIVVGNNQAELQFEPGEYRIYTSEKLTPPNGFFVVNTEDIEVGSLEVFPNPVVKNASFQILLEKNENVETIQVSNTLGQMQELSFDQNGAQVSVATLTLPSGLYTLQVETKERIYVQKIVIE